MNPLEDEMHIDGEEGAVHSFTFKKLGLWLEESLEGWDIEGSKQALMVLRDMARTKPEIKSALRDFEKQAVEYMNSVYEQMKAATIASQRKNDQKAQRAEKSLDIKRTDFHDEVIKSILLLLILLEKYKLPLPNDVMFNLELHKKDAIRAYRSHFGKFALTAGMVIFEEYKANNA